MAIAPRSLIIGLTGPFGSGCSTAAESLRLKGFRYVSLSQPIKDRFARENPGKTSRRADLQSLGNTMRTEAGLSGILTKISMEEVEGDVSSYSRIVIDGIRNLGEVAWLRENYGTAFFLVALDCEAGDRWERLQGKYQSRGMSIRDFNDEDERDAGEEGRNGQQVERCVDAADVFIVNSQSVNTVAMLKRLDRHVRLLSGEEPRFAVPTEIYMNLAYSAAHGSKCLKRQVGAVIVAAPPHEAGEIVGTGFNENPPTTKPCVEEPIYEASEKRRGRCFRDIVRSKQFLQLVDTKWHCPKCGQLLTGPISDLPPWNCSSCQASLDKMFWPDRAMSFCTAIHAEVAALMSAGPRARNATLYTTAFPCFQCAEKLMQAGISYVVFTEFYPDAHTGQRLLMGGVDTERFEGIRSRRFDEIFSRARPFAEGGADA